MTRPKQSSAWNINPYILASGLAAIVAGAGGILWLSQPSESATQITLTGTVAQNCTIDVTADANASSLNLTAAGSQHVQIGTILQNCNKKAGYTVTVTSANCATGTAGAKVIGALASPENLAYSVSATNPSTGGSTNPTGLLATVCTAQVARTVTNAKISGETSTVFADYTGNTALAADTYTDTLTFTMNVN